MKPSQEFVIMKTLYQNIKIPALKGKKTIAQADDVFSYLDSDFERWGMDKIGEKTEETELAVMEIVKDGTFKDIFVNPETLVLSQEQIIEFCGNHGDKLRKDGYATFFLFKVNGEFFVACVRVESGDREARVVRFDCDDVWDAEAGPRVVVPQLALKNLEIENALEPSDTSTLPDILIINGVSYKRE